MAAAHYYNVVIIPQLFPPKTTLPCSKANDISRLLKKAHLLRYASALAAHVHLKYAPLLDPLDALQLNLFEQPA
jgi:hypothetical protein